MLARVSRLAFAAVLGSAFVVAFAGEASAQVTATCSLNEVENRVYNLVPLSGTLKSTEEQLTPDLPFRQYLPNGHDPTKKWPVIIFLHGIGEVGGTLLKVTEHSLPRMVEAPDWDWPFIVMSPVLPTNNWLPRAQLVSDIFDHAVNTLGGDPNRLYLTGVSHGGEGTLAIGIELAAKVAALMPVTPGGEPDNWANHAAIASKPNLIIIGTADSQYANSQGWATDLETAGAPMFNDYTLPATDEHLDTIPATILDQSHAFISYQDLPHDIWHAAYGNFCNDMAMLITYKTVQYEWLLKQSLDGSPFVDPRGGTPPVGGAGGMGGAAGGGGTAAGAGGMAAAGGSAGATVGGMGGAGGTPVTMMPTAGAGMQPAAPSAANSQSAEEGSCSLVQGSRGSSGGSWLLVLAGLASALVRRSRGARR